MKVIRVISSNIGNNSYILLAKKPAIIDPSEDIDAILNHLKENTNPEELKYIILTHYHFDHVLGVPKLKKITNAKVMIHELDASFLNFKPDKLLEDNEIVDLNGCKLRVIHTPGHTPGGICLYEPKSKSLFSGDTLFAHGGFGRTDLGGNINQLVESLKKLSELKLKIIYPGHDEIIKQNPKKQIKDSLRNAQIYL